MRYARHMQLRLPLALLLAFSSLTLAVVQFWPFVPPEREDRTAAALPSSAPASLLPFLDDALYASLGKPQPGEWLASHQEDGQNVADFRKSSPNIPSRTRKVLYLLPLGKFPADGRTPSLDSLREYLSVYFQMEAKLAPAVTEAAPGAKRRINPGSGKPQLLSTDILKWLAGRLPSDAYCVLAVTMTDLFPEESWNFVFGQASLSRRVGVFSLARNDPAFSSMEDPGLDPGVTRSLLLRRACITLSHETGHMFGWSHCCYYKCLMGGSNSLAESDRAPAGLCPVCLQKLHFSRPFDPVARQKGLLVFYQKHGMEEDRKKAQVILDAAGVGSGR